MTVIVCSRMCSGEEEFCRKAMRIRGSGTGPVRIAFPNCIHAILRNQINEETLSPIREPDVRIESGRKPLKVIQTDRQLCSQGCEDTAVQPGSKHLPPEVADGGGLERLAVMVDLLAQFTKLDVTMRDDWMDGALETLVQGCAFVILNCDVNREECLEQFLQLGPEFRERIRFGGISEVLHDSSNELGGAGDVVQGRLVEVREASYGRSIIGPARTGLGSA